MATLIPVTFRFPARLMPTARSVSVIGSFNGWNPQVHRLRRTPENEWAVTVYLTPGRAVYCFSVDGVMWLDPADEGRVPNGWGSEYSVRHVASGAEAVFAAAHPA
ncbi:MAG: isoamylase early set domain-containing protein [bacterium]